MTRGWPCASIFAGCVVPRKELEYPSGAKFNAAACANHQYQCEGSKYVPGGVAQTKQQAPIVQAQSTAAQAKPPAAHIVAAHVQVPTAQPGGPHYGSSQTPQGIQTYTHPFAPTSAVSPHGPPAQAPSFQSGDYVGADPAQGYAYHGHTAQGHAPDTAYGDPFLYGEQFTNVHPPAQASDFQQFQQAASTPNASSQIVTSRVLTGQGHPSAAYMSPACPAQEPFFSPHPIFDPNRAYQLHVAGMDHDDQGVLAGNTLGNPTANAAQDDPGLGVLQSFLDGSHEESRDNDGDLQL